MKNCEALAQTLREYEGVTRKHDIGKMLQIFKRRDPKIIADFGEDAAVIEHNGEALLFAADGIWCRLMDVDPYWAGYCAVLVNIHDIAAMGGRPLALVDVLSITDAESQNEVTRGMYAASTQFGVPLVGGHLHPDAQYSSVAVSILGTAPLDSVIYSHTAKEGDRLIIALDLNGNLHPSCSLNWDSVTMKSHEVVRAQVALLGELGGRHLVTAGKDISNPGIIGTIGMLLEVSKAGAMITIEKIPRPDPLPEGLTVDAWLKIYPGMGFVLTAKEENVHEIIRLFESVGLTASEVGTVDNSHLVRISYQGEEAVVFDLNDRGILEISDERE